MSNLYTLFDELITQVNSSLKDYPQKLSVEKLEQISYNLGYKKVRYYSSINDALDDIYYATEDRITINNPKVMVQDDVDGVPVISLLSDCEQNGYVVVDNSIKLFLNSHTLKINGGTMQVSTGIDVSIFGGNTNNRGTIISTPAEGKVGTAIQFYGNNLNCYNTQLSVSTSQQRAVYGIYLYTYSNVNIVNCNIDVTYNGGTYGEKYSAGIYSQNCLSTINISSCNINCVSNGMNMYGIMCNTGDSFTIEKCNINIEVTSNHIAFAIVNRSGTNCNIRDSVICSYTQSNNTSYRQCLGVLNEGYLLMENCRCDLKIDGHRGYVVENYVNSQAILRNCNFKVTLLSEVGDLSVYAVLNFHKIECYDCIFWTDARYGNVGTPMALAVYNGDEAYLSNCIVTGTHSGLQHSGNSLYIDGGIYTGTWHGGIYISTDPEGKTYINNATLRDGHYDGQFGDPEQTLLTWNYWGSVYIGGSEGRDNIIANFDGCTFEGYKHGICMRGSLGEKNNTARLSNCTFAPRGYGDMNCTINYHSNTHNVHVGVGCNATSDSIYIDHTIADKTPVTDNMLVFTKDIYRGIYDGREMTEDDALALTSLLEA